MSTLAVVTKEVRYGTRFTPSVKKHVLAEGPTSCVIENFPLVIKDRAAKRSNSKFFPSISVILGCTEDKYALFKWQRTMIEQMGLAKFRRFQNERLVAGVQFHSIVSKSIQKAQKLEKLENDDIILNQAQSPVRGYVKSVLPFLRSVPITSDILCEKDVIHPTLMYKGRFDAVIRYKDKLFVVDWKTATEKSSVAENIAEGTGQKGLYGYPRQLAAYTAAINADPNYAHMAPITNCMVVLAYDSGKEADVVEINTEDTQKAWEMYLRQLNEFWTLLREHPEHCVNVIYQGD